MKLVTVYKSFNSTEAQLARSRLEAADFQAFIAHDLASLSMDGYSMATGGILVQVPEDQAENAKALLESPESPT